MEMLLPQMEAIRKSIATFLQREFKIINNNSNNNQLILDLTSLGIELDLQIIRAD